MEEKSDISEGKNKGGKWKKRRDRKRERGEYKKNLRVQCLLEP